MSDNVSESPRCIATPHAEAVYVFVAAVDSFAPRCGTPAVGEVDFGAKYAHEKGPLCAPCHARMAIGHPAWSTWRAYPLPATHPPNALAAADDGSGGFVPGLGPQELAGTWWDPAIAPMPKPAEIIRHGRVSGGTMADAERAMRTFLPVGAELVWWHARTDRLGHEWRMGYREAAHVAKAPPAPPNAGHPWTWNTIRDPSVRPEHALPLGDRWKNFTPAPLPNQRCVTAPLVNPTREQVADALRRTGQVTVRVPAAPTPERIEVDLTRAGCPRVSEPAKREAAQRARLRELVTLSLTTISEAFGLFLDPDAPISRRALDHAAVWERRLHSMTPMMNLREGHRDPAVMFRLLEAGKAIRAYWITAYGADKAWLSDFAEHVPARDLARIIERLTADPLVGTR